MRKRVVVKANERWAYPLALAEKAGTVSAGYGLVTHGDVPLIWMNPDTWYPTRMPKNTNTRKVYFLNEKKNDN